MKLKRRESSRELGKKGKFFLSFLCHFLLFCLLPRLLTSIGTLAFFFSLFLSDFGSIIEFGFFCLDLLVRFPNPRLRVPT